MKDGYRSGRFRMAAKERRQYGPCFQFRLQLIQVSNLLQELLTGTDFLVVE